MQRKPSIFLLPIIVFSQFAGTSLWFAGNAIINEIQKENTSAGVAHLTSLVQFGFITGTLVFAVLTIADRFKPSAVFFVSSCIAALANVSIILIAKDIFLVGAFRFVTGFFLAGIYPVGMKIAADWFAGKLGNALGFLVGALVVGTAFPYLLKSQLYALPWKGVLLFTSLLAFVGGLILLVAVPAKIPVTKNRFEPGAFLQVFRSAGFRSAAFGYFGHMWELYTFWAFIPVLLQRYNQQRGQDINTYLWSFLIIAIGGGGCIAGGILSQKTGSRKVAFVSLAISGICCLAAPFTFGSPPALFLFFLLIWGTTVVSDSPQFSSLVAQSALQQFKGTALTIVTSIGFAVTIASLQLTQLVFRKSNDALWLLAIGPLLGLLALRKGRKKLPA